MSATICECKDCKFIQNLNEYGGQCKNEKSKYYNGFVSGKGFCKKWEAKVEYIPQAETYTSKEDVSKIDKEKVIMSHQISFLFELVKVLQKSNSKLTDKISKLEEGVEVLESRTNDILARELKTITDEIDNKLQPKWIIHRTLRKINKETYVGRRTDTDYDDVKCGYTMIYQKEYAMRYDEKEAIKIRDELNEQRVGKRYLWVISKEV